MSIAARFLNVLRRGTGMQRLQMVAGATMVAGAGVWVIFVLIWRLLFVFGLIAGGAWLIYRSLRQPPSSS